MHNDTVKNIRIFILSLIGFGTILIARLSFLQIHNMLYFSLKGKRNFLRYEKITGARGNIIDCKGRLLATNRPVFSVYWVGTGRKHLDEEQKSILKILQLIFDKSFKQPDLLIAEKTCKHFLLMEDISFEFLSKLMEQFPHHKNILITTHLKRYYPHGSLASHLIGYLGLQSEQEGKMGLEKICENQLKGKEGQLLKTINSTGKHLNQQEIKKACIGTHIHSTINLELQKIAEDVFPEEYAGVFLLMNPENGALEVALSRPSFDPNVFLNKISHEQWGFIQLNNPFINRIFDACYPPGSIFKLVTITAALETELIHPQETWNCKGHIMFAGRAYHCHNHYGHGELSLMEALAYSCNIPLFDIAKRIKIDTLSHYASLFGLGNKTESLLPEKEGFIPHTRLRKWYVGETLSTAIGQISVVTPIQIARMISAINQGFLVKPRILIEEPLEISPLPFSLQTRRFLKKCMKQVVHKGLATKKLKKFTSTMKLYAKTSTAQTASLEKSKNSPLLLEHAWVAIYFIDSHKTAHTLVIVLEHAGSSRFAVGVAEKFLKKYIAILKQ